MGVRLYNPYTAGFLSTDPVLGGSANPYDYAYQDPYNKLDLDGNACAWFAWKYLCAPNPFRPVRRVARWGCATYWGIIGWGYIAGRYLGNYFWPAFGYTVYCG